MGKYFKFLLLGILFVGTQEFWVSFIWRGEFASFALAVLITETLFLTVAFFLAKLFRRIPGPRFSSLALYLSMGLIGLVVIEWIIVGNLPGQTEASQIVMFPTWGGSAIFALILTDENANEKLKRFMVLTFAILAAIATIVSLILMSVNPQLSFALTYLTAITLYPCMNIFYIWHFIGEATRT